MRRITASLVFAFLAVSAASASAETFGVKARDDYFTPDFRVLVNGDSVTWTVEGVNGHTVTSFPGSANSFDSSPETTDSCTIDGGLLGDERETDCLRAGSGFTVSFPDPGTYDYFCKIHGDPSRKPDPRAEVGAQPCQMCGRILVKPPSTSRPATRRPTPTADQTGSEPEPTASSSESMTGSPPASTDPSIVAAPGQDGGGGAPIAIAALAIGLLAGVAVLVWRRYLAPR